jgi:peroxiredoxin
MKVCSKASSKRTTVCSALPNSSRSQHLHWAAIQTGDKVRKAFGVPKAAFGLLPGRVTYVLDKDGVCQKVYDDLADAVSHVEVAKSVLKELKSGKGAAKPLFRL